MSKKHKGKHKPKPVKVTEIQAAPVVAGTKWPSSSKGYVPCHESHPVLKVGKGEILGASCNHPREGYDIYVGLDWGMQRQVAFPWEPPSEVVEVYFPVTDGSVPKDVAQFKKMIEWLMLQLDQGKRIHMGCIGGHGRTGTLLAALVSRVHGDSNAGKWVRENYCKSAIETTTQIKFLQDHFGVVPVSPSKEHWGQVKGISGVDNSSTRVTYSPVRGRSIWVDEFIEQDIEIA
jgi:hypothetical protein